MPVRSLDSPFHPPAVSSFNRPAEPSLARAVGVPLKTNPVQMPSRKLSQSSSNPEWLVLKLTAQKAIASQSPRHIDRLRLVFAQSQPPLQGSHVFRPFNTD
ncbi:hypothetical protein TWF102_002423 [Orbilia oligospora]|uniref:Uncharacterized protein n=1 Tax=Orbilia oligospora TaxID=2813651 RepID=A0A7C8JQA1_ORBOL|nr:hypothetical protein TWF706_003356 [Orbilia oligospora]KAF3080204.1 hypothetical protein TWF102_002423 [Orbilia oligospora]KAF3097563.1 hypothetical protein TWF103_009498 [Orbilia oligospora]KAF3124204.1 hypothetical protein TWF703_000506 [Orbilia oligospora]KAF3151427.1 hypothetical protein TWF594_007074 [Orbilia oligospora]